MLRNILKNFYNAMENINNVYPFIWYFQKEKTVVENDKKCPLHPYSLIRSDNNHLSPPSQYWKGCNESLRGGRQ